MDGRRCWRDNVFVERLWKSVKHEEVYLRAYESASQARESLDRPHRLLQSAPAVFQPWPDHARSVLFQHFQDDDDQRYDDQSSHDRPEPHATHHAIHPLVSSGSGHPLMNGFLSKTARPFLSNLTPTASRWTGTIRPLFSDVRAIAHFRNPCDAARIAHFRAVGLRATARAIISFLALDGDGRPRPPPAHASVPAFPIPADPAA